MIWFSNPYHFLIFYFLNLSILCTKHTVSIRLFLRAYQKIVHMEEQEAIEGEIPADSYIAMATHQGDSSGRNSHTTTDLSPMFPIQLPPFIRKDPSLWFLQVEAQFRMYAISDEQLQVDVIIFNLPADIIQKIQRLVHSLPT